MLIINKDKCKHTFYNKRVLFVLQTAGFKFQEALGLMHASLIFPLQQRNYCENSYGHYNNNMLTVSQLYSWIHSNNMSLFRLLKM